MNTQLRVKSIKLSADDNFGQRFKECREWKGLTQRDVYGLKRGGHSLFELNQRKPRLGMLVKSAKGIGIQSINITLANKGIKQEVSSNNYGKVLKEIRIKQDKSQNDVLGERQTTICNIENMKHDTEMETLLEYAKALGIKTLIINID